MHYLVESRRDQQDGNIQKIQKMKDYQYSFIEFAIQNKVLTFGSFKLKSGRQSPYFFNAGLFNSGSALRSLGEYYASALLDSGLEYDILFGPAYKVFIKRILFNKKKGIPLVSSLAVAMSHKGINTQYAFNRKVAKDHGEGGMIVGTPLNGRIVVVDDVITAGTAIRESVEIIKAQGAHLNGVLVAIDRQEKGKDTELSAIQQVESEFGIKVVSIVDLGHVIEYLSSKGGYEDALLEMKKYQSQWCVK